LFHFVSFVGFGGKYRRRPPGFPLDTRSLVAVQLAGYLRRLRKSPVLLFIGPGEGKLRENNDEFER
jgi:hypothetical protein